jgi:cyclopropane-fatty-acyl-phospholipid synthase
MSHATDVQGRPEAGAPDGQPPWGPVAVDPGRWPDVAAVPGSGPRAAIARQLFRQLARRLPFRVRSADGRSFGSGSHGDPVMVLHRPEDFYARVGAAGLIGFGESYMAGDWDCDRLTELLTTLGRQVDRLVPPRLQWLRNAYVRRQPADTDANPDGARRNIQRHYDLSNDLFALFLDETMTYSSAWFSSAADGIPLGAAGGPPGPGDLAAAQRRKIDRLLDEAGVKPGTRLLEIGTGWGELAIRAAQRGAQVRSVTISEQQRDLAVRRVAEAGLAGQVSVELLDYRQVEGSYDAIVSVEMIEAVARRYWPDYFGALARLLAPGGRIGLQAITMPHHRMLATRDTQTWILKYIFPGGLIPSVTAIEENAASCGLTAARAPEFSLHYAETLRIWQEKLLAYRDQLARLGFDEVFLRMWRLYLCYSEAGFRAGYLEVSQFRLTRDES